MTYAVLLSDNGGIPTIGRLELSIAVLRIGATEVAFDEIADVHIDRSPTVRLAGRPTLVIERRDGSSMRVASFDGVGSLHELAERLETCVRAG